MARRTEGDAIALLEADHRMVEAIFDAYDKLGDDADVERLSLALQACVELDVHARLEEEVFYPAARDALGKEGEDLLDEAEVEHASVKDLITQISAMQPGDALYDAKVKVLGEYVKHHVKEEEDELFPKLRRSGLDLDALGARMAERKQALMQQTDAATAAA